MLCWSYLSNLGTYIALRGVKYLNVGLNTLVSPLACVAITISCKIVPCMGVQNATATYLWWLIAVQTLYNNHNHCKTYQQWPIKLGVATCGNG